MDLDVSSRCFLAWQFFSQHEIKYMQFLIQKFSEYKYSLPHPNPALSKKSSKLTIKTQERHSGLFFVNNIYFTYCSGVSIISIELLNVDRVIPKTDFCVFLIICNFMKEFQKWTLEKNCQKQCRHGSWTGLSQLWPAEESSLLIEGTKSNKIIAWCQV